MENPRAEKVAVVNEVRERFSAAGAAVLTEYRGLNVAAISQLRRQLREAGGEYKIYKNTLVRFAARDLGLEIEELLTGPTAIAFVGDDIAGGIKALNDFVRTSRLTNLIRGALFGPSLVPADQVEQLATIPTRPQLYGQIVGSVNGPLAGLVGSLNGLLGQLVNTLQNYADKQGGGGETAAEPAAEAAPAAAEG